MPLQKNAVGSHAKIPKQVKGGKIPMMRAVLNAAPMPDAMDKGIMAVYEVFRWWRGEIEGVGMTRSCMWRETRHVFCCKLRLRNSFSSHGLTV